MRVLIFVLALVALALPAQAQSDPCSESEPCEWVVNVDESGFYCEDGGLEACEPSWNGTQGDWMVFDFSNLDLDDDHVLSLSGYGLSWTVGSIDELRTEPFLLRDAGEFALVDETAQDEAMVRVFVNSAAAVESGEEDPILDEDEVPDGAEGGDDSEGDAESVPGLGVVALVALLVAIALVRRK